VAAAGAARPSHRMAAGEGVEGSQSTLGGQVAGAARRPGTRERGHRVHRGGAGLVRPSHRMAAGAARRPGTGERGHRVHQAAGAARRSARGRGVKEYTGGVLG
jgi:hypothetical protein